VPHKGSVSLIAGKLKVPKVVMESLSAVVAMATIAKSVRSTNFLIVRIR